MRPSMHLHRSCTLFARPTLDGAPRRAGLWAACLVASSAVVSSFPVAVRPDVPGVALQTAGVHAYFYVMGVSPLTAWLLWLPTWLATTVAVSAASYYVYERQFLRFKEHLSVVPSRAA